MKKRFDEKMVELQSEETIENKVMKFIITKVLIQETKEVKKQQIGTYNCKGIF